MCTIDSNTHSTNIYLYTILTYDNRAFKKAYELNRHDFQASSGWLPKFKYCHRILNRRVTKLVTKKIVESLEEIKQSAEDFVSISKNIIKKYHPNEVLNTDQLGIELESHGNRTLTYSGAKSTWASFDQWEQQLISSQSNR